MPAQLKTSQPLLIAVMGTTASGKTPLAEALAERLGAGLINADAFQIYRGMDIGTAKPIHKHRYSLLDIKNPDEGFGVGEWVQLATHELELLWSQGRSAIVVGGTGLYIRALFEEFDGLHPAPDPELRADLERRERDEGLANLFAELMERDLEAAKLIDPKNPARVRRALERLYSNAVPMTVSIPPFIRIKFAIDRTLEMLNESIATRTQDMMQNGWSQEVTTLLQNGYVPENPGFRALGYRQVCNYLERKLDLQEAIATTIAATRQYAKRQRTWLASEPGLVRLTDGSALEVFDRAMGVIVATYS